MGGTSFNGIGINVDIQKSLSVTQKNLFDRRSLAGGDDPQLQAAVGALIRQGASVKVIPSAKSATASDSSAASAENAD
jgi:hypothetical protein